MPLRGAVSCGTGVGLVLPVGEIVEKTLGEVEDVKLKMSCQTLGGRIVICCLSCGMNRREQ